MDDLVLDHKAGETLDLSRATIYSILQVKKKSYSLLTVPECVNEKIKLPHFEPAKTGQAACRVA